jgi:hypothetical protein
MWTSSDPVVRIPAHLHPLPGSVEGPQLFPRRADMTFCHTLLASFAVGSTLLASPPEKLGNFELTDQNAITRSYRFPRPRVAVMTVADREGSQQLAPWVQRIYKRYEKRIDIDGIADLSTVPQRWRRLVREVFRQRLTHSVMLDWGGTVVNQFRYERGVANIYVIDRDGRILSHVTGPINHVAEQELFHTIDRTINHTTSG